VGWDGDGDGDGLIERGGSDSDDEDDQDQDQDQDRIRRSVYAVCKSTFSSGAIVDRCIVWWTIEFSSLLFQSLSGVFFFFFLTSLFPSTLFGLGTMASGLVCSHQSKCIMYCYCSV